MINGKASSYSGSTAHIFYIVAGALQLMLVHQLQDTPLSAFTQIHGNYIFDTQRHQVLNCFLFVAIATDLGNVTIFIRATDDMITILCHVTNNCGWHKHFRFY